MSKKRKSGADLAARFAKIGEAVETEAEKALFEIGVKVKDAANANSPQGKRLKGSWAVRLRYAGTRPVVRVGTLVKEAVFVEHAKKIDGHAYGKNLRQPGRVVYKALDDNTNEIERMVADAIGRGLGSVGGA